jgi:hypothetical protein
MTQNRLTSQAVNAFGARLDDMISRLARDILNVKQSFNARGMLTSSQTVWEIYRCVDAAIVEMGKAASESARLAYEAGHHSYSDTLESELLDTFEHNFSLGFERLVALRASETEPIARGFLSLQMLESTEYLLVARHAQTNGQFELRQYFQTLKRGRKRWYEFIPPLAKIVMWLSK